MSRDRDDEARDLGSAPGDSRQSQAIEHGRDPRDDARWPERERDERTRDTTLAKCSGATSTSREGWSAKLVRNRGREYTLRGSETRTLATAGAFRVVSSRDHIMPGQARRFLASLDDEQDGYDTVGDIAWMSQSFNRACGMARLLARRRHASIERRLPALLQALRVLQNDRTFQRDTETFPGYLAAATDLARGGFDFVLFGHTHLARDIPIAGGARYLNTGAWSDRIRFPHELLGGSERQALDALRAFVSDMADGRLSAWLEFAPTCVRLDTDDSGRVVEAELFDC